MSNEIIRRLPRDISRCLDHRCPSRNKCMRYISPPVDQYQVYADFSRKKEDTECSSIIPVGESHGIA